MKALQTLRPMFFLVPSAILIGFGMRILALNAVNYQESITIINNSKGICDSYPLAVGYSADEVSASNFTYINSGALPCPAGLYQLSGVEISGMNYTEVKLH